MATAQQKLEAVLFWKGEPMQKKELRSLLSFDEDTLKTAVSELRAVLEGRGVTLIETADELSMATSAETSALIEQLTKEELNKDIGRAGLETLSLILYSGPISRRDIDYIRGVNSTFILRNLLIRGLIERIQNEKDQRSFLYRPTTALFAHLGISGTNALPEYDAIKSTLENIAAEALSKEGTSEENNSAQ